jgi:ankyrin repeat protein
MIIYVPLVLSFLRLVLGDRNYDFEFAVGAKDVDTVASILAGPRGDLDVNRKFSEHPPLHIAAGNGTLDIVKLLIEQGGVDVGLKDFNGTTAMFRAVENNFPEVIKYLHSKGGNIAEINYVGDDLFEPLIVTAARHGHIEATKMLLSLGCDLESKSYFRPGLPAKYGGDTALLSAIFGGHHELVQELVNAGADLRVRNVQGNGPLHAAVFAESTKLTDMFIRAGLNVSEVNKNGFNPVMLATSKRNHKVLRQLFKAGASVDTRDGIDFNPLITATRSYLMPMINEILSWNPRINTYDSSNYTALYHAFSTNHIDLGRRYLRRGAALGFINDHAKGMIDEFSRFVLTCDWFQGILTSNKLQLHQVSGPEPRMSHCDLIRSIKGGPSIIRLIDQANLYGYNALVGRLNIASFNNNTDPSFEGVKNAEKRAYLDIKHLHSIDYRKKYEEDLDVENVKITKMMHLFSDSVEPPRKEKEITLSDILEGTETLRQVHRPDPEQRPEHARNAKSMFSSKAQHPKEKETHVEL